MAVQLDRVLATAVGRKASDVHFRVGLPPMLRIDGELRPLTTAAYKDEDVVSAVKAAAGGKDKIHLDLFERGGADFAYEHTDANGTARFRVNAFREQGHQAMVMRRLPTKIFTPEEIGFNPKVLEACKRPRGLFLVTGPTGSGKTSTLACIVTHIASSRPQHILTLEEPTEYRLTSTRSVISQREIPGDCPTFSEGLRQALREDPNTIVVGEMRDLETMECAIRASETGHLVLGTLHTVSAAKTLDRIIDSFGNREAEIRSILSTSLIGVLGQQLIPRADGEGRVAAFEFMLMNAAIAHAIRERQVSTITNAIQTNRASGMRLLDDHLLELVLTRVVKPDDALAKSSDPDKLRAEFIRGGAM